MKKKFSQCIVTAVALALLCAVLVAIIALLLAAIRVMRGEVVGKRVWYEGKVGELEVAFKAKEVLLDERHRAEERLWIDEGRRRDEEFAKRERALVDKVVEYAGRPPVIIDPSEAVRSIGEAISRITQGPESVLTEQTKLKQQVAENWETAMGRADPGEGVGFVPFGDVDPWMDPEGARGHDSDRDRPIEAVANGSLGGNGKGPVRNLVTGRPIEFRSGETAEPPRGGMED